MFTIERQLSFQGTLESAEKLALSIAPFLCKVEFTLSYRFAVVLHLQVALSGQNKLLL